MLFVLHQIVDRMDNMLQLRTVYGSGPLEEFNVSLKLINQSRSIEHVVGSSIPLSPQRSRIDYHHTVRYSWGFDYENATTATPPFGTACPSANGEQGA